MLEENISRDPSISSIIQEVQSNKANKQILSFFKKQTYSTFHLDSFIRSQLYKQDEKFHYLVQQLLHWNKKVQNNCLPQYSQAEFCRNKFVYTQLIKLLQSGVKGSQNYQATMNKLFEWTLKNSTQKPSLYITSRKKATQFDEDWYIRNTFKSNMPLQIKSYERRIIFSNDPSTKYLPMNTIPEKKQEKQENFQSIRVFKSKQKKQRQLREQKQLNSNKKMLKSEKSKFQQNICQSSGFFNGNFNLGYKTICSFKKHKKQDSLVGDNIDRPKTSYSMMEKQRQGILELKKYRVKEIFRKAHTTGIFQHQRQQLASNSTNLLTGGKFLDTSSTIFKQINQGKKTISVGAEKIKNKPNKNTEVSRFAASQGPSKQNSIHEFVEFKQLANFQGFSLMSNPFQKKAIKKKAKK